MYEMLLGEWGVWPLGVIMYEMLMGEWRCGHWGSSCTRC